MRIPPGTTASSTYSTPLPLSSPPPPPSPSTSSPSPLSPLPDAPLGSARILFSNFRSSIALSIPPNSLSYFIKTPQTPSPTPLKHPQTPSLPLSLLLQYQRQPGFRQISCHASQQQHPQDHPHPHLHSPQVGPHRPSPPRRPLLLLHRCLRRLLRPRSTLLPLLARAPPPRRRFYATPTLMRSSGLDTAPATGISNVPATCARTALR